MRPERLVLAVSILLGVVGGTPAATPPWSRTETRQPCASFAPLRQPWFGDLHVHTRYSADAYIFGTRVGPRDAYDFARGSTIPLSDDLEQQTRSATIDRPLDFAAVTDHSELFGEVDACIDPTSPAFDVNLCQLLRRFETTSQEDDQSTVSWLFQVGIPNPPRYLDLCDTPGVDCAGRFVSVWQEMQAAAEEAYDRTDACRFTSFIGYEHTPSPLGRHQHRNVIFRNEHVTPIALSQLDTIQGGFPQGLWDAIETQCTGAGTGCDALIIPHNSNRSYGIQFVDPVDGADALRRQTFEPLAEIHQIKGNSECRFDRLAGVGVGTADEECDFEQLPSAGEGLYSDPVAIGQYPRRNLLRPTLEDGLAFEGTLGANPFRFGFIGSTDNHDGTPGAVAEQGWMGGQGRHDGSPAQMIAQELRTNPGGLAVAWAEENSRDAVFAALRRRETYATSGTRPVVRFFAGALGGVACGAPDFVARAYETGVPMGGELGRARGSAGPRFAVWATKDPGTATAPGADLQRIQIVKGWVDADGKTREKTVDVAGGPNAAGVDPATCMPTGTGAAELCAVWEDPDWNPDERAFYYARVLEDPVCRWSTRVCKQAGVDPFAADCAAQAAVAPVAFADCCLADGRSDASLAPTVQERAWTSPIWYRPDGLGRFRAQLVFAREPGRDAVVLRTTLGPPAPTLDPVRDGITVRVEDDDEIFAIRVPPNALRRRGRRLTYKTRDAGTRTLVVTLGRRNARLAVIGRGVDLAHAAHEDHPVSVTVESGVYRATYARTWLLRGARLEPAT